MSLFTGFDEAVVVDVETTGLDPKSCRIVSLGMIRSDFAKLKENPEGMSGATMDAIINPECHIPRDASRIHGIYNKHVVDKKTFKELAQEIRDFIGDRPIIAHNASFDKRFLNAEFKRAGVKTLARNKSYCTMRRFQEENGGMRKGSNLDNVVRIMGIQRRKGSIHDASEDANLAWQVAGLFYMMDNNIKPPGVQSETNKNSSMKIIFIVSVIVVLGIIILSIF